MKHFIVALSLLFVAGCATNGGPLDATFYAKGYNKVLGYVQGKAVDVVNVVVPTPVKRVVDKVVYEALTTFEQKVKDCEEKGGRMGKSEDCHLPK